MRLIVCTAVVFASLFFFCVFVFLLQFKIFFCLFMCAFAYLLQLKYLVTIEMFFLLLLLFCFVFPLGPAAQRDFLLLFLCGRALFFHNYFV